VLAGAVCVGPVEVSTDEDVTLGAVLDLAAAVDEAEEEEEDEDVAGAVADDPPEVADPVAGRLEVGGPGVVQLATGAGPVDFVAGTAELEVLLALGLELAVLLALGLAVLGLGLAVLGLGLGLGVSLGLAVPLLALPLDDTAGEVVALVCADVVALADEPDLVDFADELGEGELQEVAFPLGLKPAMLDDVPAPVGVCVPLWLAVDAELLADGEAPVIAELSVDPMCPTSARAAGTEARTTPTVNTVRPVAKAGRSMVSRQSRFGVRRPGAGRSGRGRRPRKPRMAGQRALTPWCWLARDERERIFSRIRSRPSAPGST
jgi:hypothetical protein